MKCHSCNTNNPVKYYLHEETTKCLEDVCGNGETFLKEECDMGGSLGSGGDALY